MKREVFFRGVKFKPETIKEAASLLIGLVPGDERTDRPDLGLHASLPYDKWTYDDQDEFFADYRREDCHDASFHLMPSKLGSNYALWISFSSWGEYEPWEHVTTRISVEAPSRSAIHKVCDVFESNEDLVRIPAPPEEDKVVDPRWEDTVAVFIGHGHDGAWRELSDSLEKQHHIHTEAFEFAANAGHATRSILERLLETASFAALVMTAEDQDAVGGMHARENVVHETGLFQGKLGFDRAVVLLEDGCNEFSNIVTVQSVPR